MRHRHAAIATLVVALAVTAAAACGGSGTGTTPPTSSEPTFADEIALLTEDPAVRFVPPYSVVDQTRITEECLGGFDPREPEIFESVTYPVDVGPSEVADDFLAFFTQAGWQLRGNFPQDDGGVSLRFAKDQSGWTAAVDVVVLPPGSLYGNGYVEKRATLDSDVCG